MVNSVLILVDFIISMITQVRVKIGTFRFNLVLYLLNLQPGDVLKEKSSLTLLIERNLHEDMCREGR